MTADAQPTGVLAAAGLIGGLVLMAALATAESSRASCLPRPEDRLQLNPAWHGRDEDREWAEHEANPFGGGRGKRSRGRGYDPKYGRRPWPRRQQQR